MKNFLRGNLSAAAIPSLEFPCLRKTAPKIKIAVAFCSNLILHHNLLNFNKKIKKIQYFLLKCVYKNQYNVKEYKKHEKNRGDLILIFYMNWKILTRNLCYNWK